MTGKVSDVHSRDTENNNVRNAIDVEKPEAGKFRTILPQVNLCSIVISLNKKKKTI